MQWPVVYERKIRYSDTDAQKIVFNGNYLTYIDDTLTDYVEALGWEEMDALGLDIVLVHIELDFASPARLGETVAVGLRATSIGNSSVRFAFRIWEQSTDRTIVEGSAVHVVVDAQNLEKRLVPSVLVAGIEQLQGEPLTRP